KNTSQKFFEEKCTVADLRKFEASKNKFSSELYKELADMGFLGLVIPEKYGGFDGRLMDLAIVVEEAGRATLPSPFLSTITYGVLPILQYGTEEQKQELLPLIAEGNLMVSDALSESQAHYDLKNVTTYAEKNSGGGYSLSGTKLFVPYASSAQYLLTLAKTPKGLSLFLVKGDQNGIKTTPLNSIGTEGLFEVAFENVTLSDSDMLGQEGQGLELTEYILQTATALQCVEMTG